MLKYKSKFKEEKKEEIIKEFLPYIKYTAYRLSWKLPAHVTIDDLISVGLMGLMDALERFEPGKVKLKTYAELRIKGAMIDELWQRPGSRGSIHRAPIRNGSRIRRPWPRRVPTAWPLDRGSRQSG